MDPEIIESILLATPIVALVALGMWLMCRNTKVTEPDHSKGWEDL